jgi:tRNA(adenine34) deaminase
MMRRALVVAERAARQDEIPVGCLIVRDGEILAEGFNSREAGKDPTAHAEVVAIRRAAQKLDAWRLLDCTLYVTLEPCIQCVGAMILARVPRVVFGCTDPKGGALGSVVDLRAVEGVNHHLDVTEGVLAEECSSLLSSFFKRIRTER